jgi:hypothetical protein
MKAQLRPENRAGTKLHPAAYSPVEMISMRSVGTILVFTILLGLLTAVGWFAWAGIAAPDEPMPSERYVALVLGAFTAVLVGLGLMTLVFYSSRRGYDEPPHFPEDRRYE